jgi:Lysozyme like domain
MPAKLKTPIGDAPVIPLIILMTGGYLAWFGIHYWRSDIKWPTDPLKDVLQGKGLPQSSKESSSQSQLVSAVSSTSVTSDTGSAAGSGGGGGSAGGGSAGNLASYTHDQLMQLWQANGGSSSSAKNAACHAIQESSGNPKATSHNPDGGTNVGLWQLDTRGVGSGYTVTQLQDPNTNARITVMHTANGTNWAQWATPGC